jgi:hypothetical protein
VGGGRGGERPQHRIKTGNIKTKAAIQNKMNFKTFLSPLLRIISFPYNFSTFPPSSPPSLRPFKIVKNEATINFNSQKNISQSEVNRTGKKNNSI